MNLKDVVDFLSEFIEICSEAKEMTVEFTHPVTLERDILVELDITLDSEKKTAFIELL